MVKIAIGFSVLAGFIIGGTFLKGASEEIIFQNISPTTGLIIGAVIIGLAWMRLKKKI